MKLLLMFEEFRYSRGFLVAPVEHQAQVPAGWKSRVIDGLSCWSAPGLQVTASEYGKAYLQALGTIFDARNPAFGAQHVTDALVACLAESEDRFLKELDCIGGRFALLYRTADSRWRIVGDATGMRSIFYAIDEPVIALHAALLHENVRDCGGIDENIRFRFGMPGLRTGRKGTRLLSPNTLLDLESRKVKRFWPRNSIPRRQVDEVTREVEVLLANAFSYAAGYRLLVSLTAGLDSRLTLALAQEFPQVVYFTYYRDDTVDTDKLDREFAEAVASDLDLEHHLLTREQFKEAPGDFIELMKLNSLCKHLPRVAYSYLSEFGCKGYLHLRSNLAEIGRQFYAHLRPRIVGPSRRSVKSSARALVQLWSPSVFRAGGPECSAAEAFFQEFLETTEFLSNQQRVDLSSLFYWEHRMGSWHSQVAIQGDPAFESISLYNVRRILELLLSVSTEDRRLGTVPRRIIERRAPELTRYPVNGEPF